MSSNDITKKPDDRADDRPDLAVVTLDTGGPSVMAADEPTFARTLAMIGGAFVIFGGMALGFNLAQGSARVSTGWAVFALTLGLCFLLFHAAFDRDIQLRRLYMGFGLAVVVLGLILCVVPNPSGDLDYADKIRSQFRWASPCLVIGLLFLISFLRNEDDPAIRNYSQLFLGGVGAVLAIAGLLGGFLKAEYFLPMGLLLGVLGLLYVTAFIASRGVSDDIGYYASLGLCGLGALVIVVALGRSIFPAEGSRFFVQQGFLFFLAGLLAVALGGGLSLDWPLFVLTRRELSSFFLSPIAYLTLLGFAVISWVQYYNFINMLYESSASPPRVAPMTEPIVVSYFVAIFPVLTTVFTPSVLTMRLLSEEQRSGTMEVLLTAPVDETVVVFSKFLAGLISFLVVWLPFGLYLVTIPLAGGTPFDYRPLLSFFITLVATGAAFISIGLFFSSITKNQIASGVLTFAAMLVLTLVYWVIDFSNDETVKKVLTHMSYIHLWIETLQGKILFQYLLFFPSLAAVMLFSTIKILESRKWR